MNTFTEVIKKVQQVILCPVCKRKYNLEEIKLRGFLDNLYILETVCNKEHPPVFTVCLMINKQEKNITENLFSPIQNQKQNPAITPISRDETILMHQSLKNFDGDFEKLWIK